MKSLFEEYGGAILSMLGAVAIMFISIEFMSGGKLAVALSNAINFYF